MKKFSFGCIVVVFSCTLPHVMADIVLLSVSGDLSGSGDAGATSDLTSQFQSFNLSDSIGSGSATATAQGTFFEEDASAEATASQGFDVSDNNISIEMQSSGSGSEEGPPIFGVATAFADAQVTDDLSLEIELTNAYMVELSGSLFVTCSPETDFGCGGGSIDLFHQVFLDDITGVIVNQQFLLAPGIYTVSVSSSWSENAFGGYLNPHEFDASADLSFNADFTQVVPEPRSISLLVMPLALSISLVTAWRRVLRRY